jgi:hypothetical protein
MVVAELLRAGATLGNLGSQLGKLVDMPPCSCCAAHHGAAFRRAADFRTTKNVLRIERVYD